MVVGDINTFAIETEITATATNWIWGHFRFWIGGSTVGDWDDITDLKGCVHWLREFEQVPCNRYDPRLDVLEPAEIFELLYDTVFGENAIADPFAQPILQAFARFHISHLGMSAFENFDLLLVSHKDGYERCLWRNAGNALIHEVRLIPNEIENVAREFCDQFEKEQHAITG